jgi:hypothetical protein
MDSIQAERLIQVKPRLQSKKTKAAKVVEIGADAWRLEIPAGPQGPYRLAQLDDYTGKPRRAFPWKPPLRLSLRARASATNIPGTWGFGLWNDPFGLAILRGVEILRLPTLPNTAWFFFASPPNYLSLRDDLPAHGSLAATFNSPRLPAPVLALGLPALPLLLLPPTARLLRGLGRRIVHQDAVQMEIDVRDWHKFELDWQGERVIFLVDDEIRLQTNVAPQGPLGLALWVDNQFAAFSPAGRIRFGTLENPEAAWVEIQDLQVESVLY